MAKEKTDESATVRKKEEPEIRANSGDVIYWILADIKNVSAEAKDYAGMHSTIELWIKEKSRARATAFAKRWLGEDEWQFKKNFLITEVTPGFARLGAMSNPPVFSNDEADEWLEHFRVADTEGIDYAFAHYPKSKPKRG